MNESVLLKIRAYNNRLVKAREELGYTQRYAAEQIGLTPTTLGAYESFKLQALRNGEWAESALRVAAFYGYSPEYLWPEDIRQIRKSAFRLEASAAELIALPADPDRFKQLHDGIKTAITPRERRVIAMRVDGTTFVEIGEQFEVGAQRVRQIENGAHRKLRDALRKKTPEYLLLPEGVTPATNDLARGCRTIRKLVNEYPRSRCYCGCAPYSWLGFVNGEKSYIGCSACIRQWKRDGLDMRHPPVCIAYSRSMKRAYK